MGAGTLRAVLASTVGVVRVVLPHLGRLLLLCCLSAAHRATPQRALHAEPDGARAPCLPGRGRGQAALAGTANVGQT